MSIFRRKDPSVLQQEMAAFTAKKGFESDGKEWKLAQDKQGNGSAVIRFLPAASDDATTFIKLVNHGFERNGKWYIENCTSTHGDYESCPACQLIKEQNWNYEVEADKKAMYASGVTRKTSFWANILVITDKANPENEGKVFKMRFGAKVMAKITAQIEVDADCGEIPCDVTCPFEGKNFIMKVKKVAKNNNFDDSYFTDRSQIKNIDDESYQAKLMGEMHDLMGMIAKDKFKTKEELTANFNKVIGAGVRNAQRAADDFDKQMAGFEEKTDNSQAAAKAATAAEAAAMVTGSGDDMDAELNALLDEIE